MRYIWLCLLQLALSGCVSPVTPGGPGTYAYEDVRSPYGHSRGSAAEHADGLKCNHGNSDLIGQTAFNKCMLRHGWQYSYFTAPDDHHDDMQPGFDWTQLDNMHREIEQNNINGT